MLCKKDLPILEENLNKIIRLITDYGCINSPDINKLKLIQKNIIIFKDDGEFWEELIKYIYEDWDAAMRSQKKISDCYIPSENIELKAKYNKEFEESCMILDELFDTNWMYKRKWYTEQELIQLGKSGIEMWNTNYLLIVGNKTVFKSKVRGISDEAWTYAKYLGITSDNELLVKWFNADIPAFGYISLGDMSKLENGEYIVRYFLTTVPL